MASPAASPPFAAARFGLGIGETGNFPAGIRAVTNWFPQMERAFAIGLFNAGANVGAILTPLIVPLLVIWFDWRITGIFGVAWLAAWWAIYRNPDERRRVGAAELAALFFVHLLSPRLARVAIDTPRG